LLIHRYKLGADSRAGEERATALGHEPACDEEEKTMEQNESARVDDAARRGANHGNGVCTDDGRCFSFSAREAGGELFGADSAGVVRAGIGGWGV